MAKTQSYNAAEVLSGFITKPEENSNAIINEESKKPQMAVAEIKAEEVKTEKAKDESKETTKKGIDKPSGTAKAEKSTPSSNKAPIFVAPVKETKSKPTSFLLKPSTHERVKEKCAKEGISLNELVNQFLEWWLEQ